MPYKIEFENIHSLLSTCEKLKEFHRLQSEIYEKKLTELNIPFTKFHDFGAYIDLGKLTMEQKTNLPKSDIKFIEEFYELCGVKKI